MKKHHQIENVHVEKWVFYIIVDGNKIQRELKYLSPLLVAAKEDEQKEFQVLHSERSSRVRT